MAISGIEEGMKGLVYVVDRETTIGSGTFDMDTLQELQRMSLDALKLMVIVCSVCRELKRGDILFCSL